MLEEGEQYKGAWLETQPMAGAMYAARNVRYALNNQLVFIRSQREDGRYPHRVDPCAGKKNVHPADPVCATLHPAWSTYLQGPFMASPAADVAWFMKLQPGNQADKYLTELKASLEAYDGYLVSMLPAACCRVVLSVLSRPLADVSSCCSGARGTTPRASRCTAVWRRPTTAQPPRPPAPPTPAACSGRTEPAIPGRTAPPNSAGR